VFNRYPRIIFVDVETTGLDSTRDRVIEIGAVKVDKNGILEKYSQLINPGFKISKEIKKLTGIRQKDLTNAPFLGDIIDEVKDVLKADLFIAHNAKFDFDFLSKEMLRLDYTLEIPYIDTIKIAKCFYPNYLTYDLTSLIARMGFKVEKRHRGLDDAHVLWELFNKINIEFGMDELESKIEKLFVPTKKKRISTSKDQALLFG
jgi:DNA polymerase-3 subunit epsilon